MRSKKKLCMLVAAIMLGSAVFSANIVSAQESVDDTQAEQEVSTVEEAKVVKGNKQLFEEAQAAMDKKDFQSAITFLTTYINSKPKRYEAYKLRGECYYELRQYKSAQEDLETAIRIKAGDDKFSTGAKVISAVVLGADKQEQYQNAELGNLYGLLMYAQKAQNNPAYEGSYQEAGRYNSHIYLPKPDKKDIAKINCPQKYGKKINQEGVDKYINDAISDIEKGDFHEAAYNTQYIISNYPKYYLGYYLSGVAHIGLEQDDVAAEAFKTSLKLNPDDFESYASLGQIYYVDSEKTFTKEDSQKSSDYFKKALELNPNCYLYHYYIGLNNLQVNDYDSAIESFNSAIKLKSDDYNSRYYKSVAQYMSGDYKAVIEETTRLLYRHVSNYNSVLYLRALANYKSGLISDSIADIEKIQNGMADIYNSDVRVISAKEQTLISYLHYLKAMISKSGGFGAAADLSEAFKNPIIKDLDNFADKGSDIAKVQIPFEDIETQYDYIRTTFSDLNLKVSCVESSYELVAQGSEDVPEIADNADDSNDLLLGDGESSIAKMLAANNFESMVVPSVKPEVQSAEASEVSKDIPVGISEKQEDEVPILRAAESIPESENVISDKVDEYTIKYPKEDASVQNTDSKILEKHAVVDMSEFNIGKASPEIKDTDEVIEFETDSFIFKAENVVPQAPFNITVPKEDSAASAVTAQASESNTEAAEGEKFDDSSVVSDSKEQVEDKIEIRTVEASDNNSEEILQQEKLGEVETNSSNPMLQRIMVPSIIPPIKDFAGFKNEAEESVAASSEIAVDSEPVIVTDTEPVDNKLQEVSEHLKEQEITEPLSQGLESAEESAEAAEDAVESEVKSKKSKVKKERKQKSKIRKEKTEKEVEIAETVEVVEPVSEPDLSPAVTYINPEKPKKKIFKFRKIGLFRRCNSDSVEEVTEVVPVVDTQEKVEESVTEVEVSDKSDKVEKLKKDKKVRVRKPKKVKEEKPVKVEKDETNEDAFNIKDFIKGFFVDVKKSDDQKVPERKVIKEIQK
ncbi:MAG: tetratricopeptide repeat protein [Muribaculaceae bacterium]|nr:tetratricopeptide repeat protein [Muribaculaceae bacterium]